MLELLWTDPSEFSVRKSHGFKSFSSDKLAEDRSADALEEAEDDSINAFADEDDEEEDEEEDEEVDDEDEEEVDEEE